MLKCAIIDDERSAVDVLIHHIEKVDYLQLVGYATNPIAGLEILRNNEIDLLFLDVRMPEISGIEIVKLAPSNIKIILTTAFTEYAFDGFEFEVVDYLLKPISLSRFIKACDKVNSLVARGKSPKIKTEEYFFVKTGVKGKLVKIYFCDIIFIESIKNYIKIYQETGEILVAGSLKDFEAILVKPSFLRIHRSYIVSIDKISAIEQNMAIFKSTGASIPIGEVYRDEFFKMISDRMF